MAKKVHEWRFTPSRRASLVKARKEHSHLIVLGKRARARGMK